MYAPTQNLLFNNDKCVSLGLVLLNTNFEAELDNWEYILNEVVQNDCRQSFKKLFDHFYPLLISYFQRSGIAKENSTELSQEVMLKVWHNASTFDATKASVATWIFVIARNTKYDYFRKIKNDPVGASSLDLYDHLDHFEVELNDLDLVVDINLLRQHVGKLNSDQQFVLQQLYFEGLSQQEMADKFDIPLGTIKSRVRLALATIRKYMEGSIQ